MTDITISPPIPSSDVNSGVSLNVEPPSIISSSSSQSTCSSKRPFSSLPQPSSPDNYFHVHSSHVVVSSSSDDDSSVSSSSITSLSATAKQKKQKVTTESSLFPLPGIGKLDDDHSVTPTMIISSSSSVNVGVSDEFMKKSVTHCSVSLGNTHYQKKYDPPPCANMSKEEISRWRREQRQQRNRISAAISRQRQKERIVELEQYIQDYKNRYEAVRKEIQRLQVKQEDISLSACATSNTMRNSLESSVEDVVTPTITESCVRNNKVAVPLSSTSNKSLESSSTTLATIPFKMISRQALSQELSYFTQIITFRFPSLLSSGR